MAGLQIDGLLSCSALCAVRQKRPDLASTEETRLFVNAIWVSSSSQPEDQASHVHGDTSRGTTRISATAAGIGKSNASPAECVSRLSCDPR